MIPPDGPQLEARREVGRTTKARHIPPKGGREAGIKFVGLNSFSGEQGLSDDVLLLKKFLVERYAVENRLSDPVPLQFGSHTQVPTPEQPNYNDCGVYMLHNVELWCLAAFQTHHPNLYDEGPTLDLHNWYPHTNIVEKRLFVQQLIISMDQYTTEHQNPDGDSNTWSWYPKEWFAQRQDAVTRYIASLGEVQEEGEGIALTPTLQPASLEVDHTTNSTVQTSVSTPVSPVAQQLEVEEVTQDVDGHGQGKGQSSTLEFHSVPQNRAQRKNWPSLEVLGKRWYYPKQARHHTFNVDYDQQKAKDLEKEMVPVLRQKANGNVSPSCKGTAKDKKAHLIYKIVCGPYHDDTRSD